MDKWLLQGGLVVTASERGARALRSAFHRARQAEGLKAWAQPNIEDWRSFVRAAWTVRTVDGRLLLNAAQERALWAAIAATDGRAAALLEGPRFRLAALAMEAHELLCSHAPKFLRPHARASWESDAGAFSRWLAAFDATCRAGNLLSPAQLPVELLELLENPADTARRANGPPLVLAGFDRILPVQRAVFEAWGEWQEAPQGEPAADLRFFEARDDQAELAACALWCRSRLAANSKARILVITQDAAKNRGQIERAFLRHATNTGSLPYEFSLGVPLSQVALAHAAHLLLRWLSGPLAEHELDWLFSTGHAASSPAETAALQAHMRALRSRGWEQPQWRLQAFLRPLAGSQIPGEWADRMAQAQRRLGEVAGRTQSPLDWAELIPHLLEEAGWPGDHALSSAEFQALRSWQQALETAGSLGFDGRRIAWKEFLSVLTRTLEETLFAAESHGAPIQIAGPAESAGLDADAVWFLGATEEAWPASGTLHPLLPIDVQREAHMPHATAQLDWELAHTVTARLLASSPEVRFSYAAQTEGTEARPSRLVSQLAALPEPLPLELIPEPSPDALTLSLEDASRIAFPPGRVAGGASVLTAQSQCPFKAFATARLAAQGWKPAEAGLTPSQRGQLLHDVLHAVWAGPPGGIRTHAELLQLAGSEAWVAGHVQRVFEADLKHGLRERMPARYLELEQQRLVHLVTAWLDYEATRIPFEVLQTEASRQIELAGLSFKVRLDRLDRLSDSTALVIDYKSGDVSPRSWEPPRPDDVQLPLYAGFALEDGLELGGLVFAKIRAGELAFAGCVGVPSETLFAGLKSYSSLAKNALTVEQLLDWRDCIEQLAKDFLAGRAEVDPKEYPKTCERCGLQTLCRIQENQGAAAGEDEPENAGGSGFAEVGDE